MAHSGGVLEPWTCHCGTSNVGPGPCSSCLNAAPPGISGALRIEEPRQATRAILPLALLTAVLLVAGAVAGVAVADDDKAAAGQKVDAATAAGLPTPPAPPGSVPAAQGRTLEVSPDQSPGPEASEAERVLPELMRFTQSARGLPFKRPVKVTLLADGPFRDRLKGEEEEDSAEAKRELEKTQRVLEGLGLLEKGLDLEKALESLYGGAVAGFYDSESDDLVVRGEELTPALRTTIVHEFTHALQDQHFDIDRKDLDDRDDESAEGLTGLVEGDAVRVEQLYLDSLTNREQREAARSESEMAGSIGKDIPRILVQLVAFPYIVGPEFARTVVRRGGQRRLDEAFAAPPTTSEQLLHPETFLAGEVAVATEAPQADGEKIDEGVLGELGLLLVLSSGGSAGAAAAQGWGGDRYVAWRDGKNTCVRTRISMDTLQDDAELRKALDALAGERDGVKVEGKGPIVFTSCG